MTDEHVRIARRCGMNGAGGLGRGHGWRGRQQREQGYVVDLVPDGETAASYLRFYQYEVAVLDWRMPKLSGLDLVQKLRRAGTATPVLMLTARDTPAARSCCWPCSVVLRWWAALISAPPEWIDRLAGVLVDNACRYAGPDGQVRIGVGLAIGDSIVRSAGGRWHVGDSPLGGALMPVSWRHSQPHRSAVPHVTAGSA